MEYGRRCISYQGHTSTHNRSVSSAFQTQQFSFIRTATQHVWLLQKPNFANDIEDSEDQASIADKIELKEQKE